MKHPCQKRITDADRKDFEKKDFESKNLGDYRAEQYNITVRNIGKLLKQMH